MGQFDRETEAAYWKGSRTAFFGKLGSGNGLLAGRSRKLLRPYRDKPREDEKDNNNFSVNPFSRPEWVVNSACSGPCNHIWGTIMIRFWEYRLYPNKTQMKILEQLLEIHRRLYNTALQQRRKASIKPRLYHQYWWLKNRYRTNDELSQCNFASLVNTLIRVEKAIGYYYALVRKGWKTNPPKLKPEGTFRSITYTYRKGVKLKDGKLHVDGVGAIKVVLHRPLPPNGRLRKATIKKFTKGRKSRWHVFFEIKLPDEPIVD